MGQSSSDYVRTPLRGIVFCMNCGEWKTAEEVDRVVEEGHPGEKRPGDI